MYIGIRAAERYRTFFIIHDFHEKIETSQLNAICTFFNFLQVDQLATTKNALSQAFCFYLNQDAFLPIEKL